ncbi:hypothetical protein IWQ62_006150, partial [Dispira parvispora]
MQLSYATVTFVVGLALSVILCSTVTAAPSENMSHRLVRRADPPKESTSTGKPAGPKKPTGLEETM